MGIHMYGSGSLAAAIAHEVNNLLTPVVGLADLLEHTGGDAAIRDQLIEQAVDRCQRAVTICALLINLAKDVVPGERSGIAEGIRRAVEAVESRAQEAFVRLECGIDDPGMVAMPEGVVEHIILNLMLNAIAASSQGGLVSLRAAYHPGSRWKPAHWCISVKDAGRGMEARQVAMVNSGGMPAGSKGIGLAVIRALCERWGGEMRVESQLGLGSTFHVKLPAA